MSLLKEISITELSNLRIGHTSDHDAKTGVTVLYFPNGAKAGCDISGGGPASRETPLTSPVTADNPINAIVLSGGSAYGLAAADGVMNYLESQNIGYNTGAALVPLVCQSCIYDIIKNWDWKSILTGIIRKKHIKEICGTDSCHHRQRRRPASSWTKHGNLFMS